MNPDLSKLQPYPFQKLAKLFAGTHPPEDLQPIRLSIGEPKHPTPALIHEALKASVDGLAIYPLTRGSDLLRETIANWLSWRFKFEDDENSERQTVDIDPATQILPVNGTREALFAFAQTVVDRTRPGAKVFMPNPFYQIYEGAALLAGAEPVFLNCTDDTGFIPDFDAVPPQAWDDCQLLYLCSPGNPTGAVIKEETLKGLIELAHKHDFIIASDECYSEIYRDEKNPPVGLLEASAAMGNQGHSRCVVFHSLSKRSNAPGLRSGFVAGDARVLEAFHQYRTYHGCAMSTAVQAASIAAWNDEEHVRANRELYRAKFHAVEKILDPVLEINVPPASFYLWVRTPIADDEFARGLVHEKSVTVLPGSYLSRTAEGMNPGERYVRMALVAEMEECVEAAERIKDYVETLRI